MDVIPNGAGKVNKPERFAAFLVYFRANSDVVVSEPEEAVVSSSVEASVTPTPDPHQTHHTRTTSVTTPDPDSGDEVGFEVGTNVAKLFGGSLFRGYITDIDEEEGTGKILYNRV